MARFLCVLSCMLVILAAPASGQTITNTQLEKDSESWTERLDEYVRLYQDALIRLGLSEDSPLVTALGSYRQGVGNGAGNELESLLESLLVDSPDALSPHAESVLADFSAEGLDLRPLSLSAIESGEVSDSACANFAVMERLLTQIEETKDLQELGFSAATARAVRENLESDTFGESDSVGALRENRDLLAGIYCHRKR